MKQTFSFFSYHKKAFVLLSIVVSILFVFGIVFFPMLQTLRQALETYGKDKYGSFHSIKWGVEQSEYEYMLKKGEQVTPKLKRTGRFGVYEQWELNESKVKLSVGFFSEEAIAVGHVQLKKGRFPIEKNEIAIENSALYSLREGIDVGDSISITMGDGTIQEMKITGILYDYTKYWEMMHEAYLIPGENDIPRIIVSPDLYGTLPSKQNVMIEFDTVDFTEAAMVLFEILQKEHDFVTYTGYYNMYYPVRVKPLYAYETILRILIYFVITVLLWFSYYIYIGNMKNAYIKLYQLGAEGEYVLKMYSMQMGLGVLIHILLGCGFVYLFSLLYPLVGKDVYHIVFRPQDILLYALLFFGINMGIILLQFVFQIRPYRNKSISALKETEDTPMKKMKTLPSFLANVSFSINYKKIGTLLLLLIIIFMFSVVSTIYVQSFSYEDTVENFDFYLSANESAGFMPYHYFLFSMARDHAYPLEEVLALKKDPAVKGMRVEWDTLGATVIIPSTKSAYWNAATRHSLYETRDKIYIAGAPRDIVGLVPMEYGVFLVNENNIIALKEQYTEIHWEDILRKDTVALFLPPYRKAETTKLYNDVLEVGDTLSLGTLSPKGTIEEAYADAANISYAQYDLQIEAIEDQAFRFMYEGIEESSGLRPYLIISEETAKSMDFFVGASYINIWLSPNLSEQEYERIEAKIERLSSKLSNTSFFSKRAETEENKVRLQVVNIIMSALLYILATFLLLVFLFILYASLQKRKKTYAIIRALGAKRKLLFYSVLIEMAYYLLLFLLGGILIGCVLGQYIGNRFFSGAILEIVDYFEYLPLLLSVTGVLAVCFTIMAYVLARSVYKTSMQQLIREEHQAKLS